MVKRLKKGDTIVEVLLAITIVATVLAGAYVLSSRSLKQARDAQERGEAVQFTEAQLESLKSIFSTPTNSSNPTNIPTVSPYTFCINTVDRSISTISNIADPSTYPAVCQSGFYYFSITNDTSSNIYTVRTIWLNVTGLGTITVNGTNLLGYNEVKMFYRVQQ